MGLAVALDPEKRKSLVKTQSQLRMENVTESIATL